jgi:hypothetical protein
MSLYADSNKSESLHDDPLSWTEWCSVLKVSYLWNMSVMRAIAVKRISSIPAVQEEWVTALQDVTRSHIPELREEAQRHWTTLDIGEVEKIYLAQKCKFPEAIVDGYKTLVTRDSASDEDEALLGTQATLDLYRLRDKYHLAERGRHPYGEFDLVAEIHKMFGAELIQAGLDLSNADLPPC